MVELRTGVLASGTIIKPMMVRFGTRGAGKSARKFEIDGL